MPRSLFSYRAHHRALKLLPSRVGDDADDIAFRLITASDDDATPPLAVEARCAVLPSGPMGCRRDYILPECHRYPFSI